MYFEVASVWTNRKYTLKSCVEEAAGARKKTKQKCGIYLDYIEEWRTQSHYTIYLLSLTSNYFISGWRHCFYGDVRNEARDPIGCPMSPMRPPPWVADNLQVWWMRWSCVCLSMCVSVGWRWGVCVCVMGGSPQCRASLWINVTVQWTISERRGQDPIDQCCYTHNTRRKKEKGPDMMTTSPRRERVRLICWAMSLL